MFFPKHTLCYILPEFNSVLSLNRCKLVKVRLGLEHVSNKASKRFEPCPRYFWWPDIISQLAYLTVVIPAEILKRCVSWGENDSTPEFLQSTLKTKSYWSTVTGSLVSSIYLSRISSCTCSILANKVHFAVPGGFHNVWLSSAKDD